MGVILLDKRGCKILAKIAFGNKQDFITENLGKIRPETMDLAIQMWFSPKGRKLPEEERSDRRKRILKQVNRMNFRTGIRKDFIKPNEKTLKRIDQLVKESSFSKNRKYKLRVFLLEMVKWKLYLKHLPIEQLMAMEALYWDISVHVFNNYIPLPTVLLGRWVSSDLPVRKPVDRFEQDIIEKLERDTDRELFLNSYYLDHTAKRFVLKKTITDEEKLAIRKILRSINYANKSSSKYIDFMKYLIKKEVIELKLAYSTHGRCNYYNINL